MGSSTGSGETEAQPQRHYALKNILNRAQIFRGEGELAKALYDLTRQPGCENNGVIVQDFVANNLEARCFVVRGKTRRKENDGGCVVHVAINARLLSLEEDFYKNLQDVRMRASLRRGR